MPDIPKSKKGLLTGLLFMLIFLGVLVVAIQKGQFLHPRASATSVDFVFNPANLTLEAGKTVDVTLSLATAMSPLPAYTSTSFTLKFDPKLLQVLEIRRVETNVPRFDSIEVLTTPNSVNRTGEMQLLAIAPKTAPSAALVALGIVKLRALAPGQATVEFVDDNRYPGKAPVVAKNATASAELPLTNPFPKMQITITVPPTPTASPTPTPEPIPPLGASGGPTHAKDPVTRTDCCDPRLAFDGNRSTFWAGDTAANVTGQEWNLYYHYATTQPEGSPLSVEYYQPYYPGSAKLFIASEGPVISWTDLGPIPAENQTPIPPTPMRFPIPAPHPFKYLRIQFLPGRDTPPYVREVTPKGDEATPPTPTPTRSITPTATPRISPTTTVTPTPSPTTTLTPTSTPLPGLTPTITIIPRPTLTADQNYTCNFCQRQYPSGGFCVNLNFTNSYFCTETVVTNPGPNIYCYTSCLTPSPTP